MQIRIVRVDRAGNRIPNTPTYGSEAAAVAESKAGEWVIVERAGFNPKAQNKKTTWKLHKSVGWRDSAGAWHDWKGTDDGNP